MSDMEKWRVWLWAVFTWSSCWWHVFQSPVPPAKVQDVMVGYFSQRPGRLAQEGLAGLQASMAGIYHVPFLTGVSMHFRFAGQSIPNRCVRACVCVVQGSGEGRTGAARCLDPLGLRMCISNVTKPAQQKQLSPAGCWAMPHSAAAAQQCYNTQQQRHAACACAIAGLRCDASTASRFTLI